MSPVLAQVESTGSMSDFDNTGQSLPGKSFAQRWNISGYIELAYQYNSDKLGARRSNPLPEFPAMNLYLPKSCVWAEFDAGKGWTLGTQIEFANQGIVPVRGIGNTGSRPMAWDQSLELSELWVQKSFSDAANLKIGLIGTPVGRQNDYPTQFFGVIRPEDGPCYLALNNQSPAIEFNGASNAWEYEVMFIPGFVNFDYGNDNWRLGSGDNTYTRTVDRLYAGAFRINNISIPGLTVGLSGEIGGGHTFVSNEEEDSTTGELRSTLVQASLDWEYDSNNMLFRGAYQYGYLAGKAKSRDYTSYFGKPVDLQAMSLGAEFGYDLFALNRNLKHKQKFYLFGRYDWCGRLNYLEETCRSSWQYGQRAAFGVNWFPMSSLIVKAEVGLGFGHDPARFFAGAGICWQPTFP